MTLQTRAGAYFLFARLFREAPPPELLQQCHWPGHAEAVAVEFARLFAVPGEQAVHSYESAYCDTLSIDTSTACSAYFESQRPLVGLPGFIGGPSASALARAYAEAGFELDPACHELPDHLSIELEFMGRLLEQGDVDGASAFIQGHLGRWVFRCLEDVKRNVPSGFYRLAAGTLATFLQHEQQLLT